MSHYDETHHLENNYRNQKSSNLCVFNDFKLCTIPESDADSVTCIIHCVQIAFDSLLKGTNPFVTL